MGVGYTWWEEGTQGGRRVHRVGGGYTGWEDGTQVVIRVHRV